MSFRIKKILVPTDFSRFADNALKYAAALARQFNAELLIIHIYNVPQIPGLSPFVADPEEVHMTINEAKKKFRLKL